MKQTPEPPSRKANVLAEGLSFLEGPRWHDGRLYVSDFFTSRILAFDEQFNCTTVCTVPGQPSGIGWLPDGSLLISSMLDRRVLRFADGRFSEHANLSDLAEWHCNDMTVDETGRVYIGNFGWDDTASDRIESTDIHSVEPDGRVSVAATDLVFPNGMAISADGATFFVAETFAARISAFDRADDGTLSNRRTWASFTSGQPTSLAKVCASGVPLPDGIALDAEGALWIGDAGGRAALRVAEGGEILDVVSSGEQASYAVALGGADRQTLFICAAVPYGTGDPSERFESRLLSAPVDVPGVGLP
jgi:sugar lactone lactonase YvrE